MPRVDVISPDQLQGDGQITKPGVLLSWNNYKRHYLAEGDSWFSLSSLLSQSFLYKLQNDVPLTQDTLIVNCAYPGDTLQRMVDWSTNRVFHKLLFEKGFAWKWDAVLFSAGGNDLIAALNGGLLRSCASPTSFRDFIVPGALKNFEKYFNDHFRYLVELRNYSEIVENRSAPILYHTYGYPTARNAPADGVFGPWLYRAFTDKNINIPSNYWVDLSDYLINELARVLRNQNDLYANLVLIDSLAKVPFTRAAVGSNGNNCDWLNEIHLNDSGKIKMAKFWAPYL